MTMRSRVLVALTSLAVAAAADRRCRADEEVSVVINPFTGAASLRNDGSAAVAIDSYLLTSADAAVLDPTAWDSLEDGGTAGWRESSSAAGNRLGELNLFESLDIPAGGSVGIGNPYVPFAPTAIGQQEPGLTSLKFSYTLGNESQARLGDVEFAARNTVVLVVDQATGAASLQNQSAFNINIDSYLVKSSSNVLDVAGWRPLAAGDSSWRSSAGAANRIAEGNLFGSTFLAANGGSMSLGNPIDPALLDDETNLALEITLANAGAIAGGVLFTGTPSTGVDADFSADGAVNGADLDIWQSGFGNPGGHGAGDANGNGLVEGNDFLAWQRQLGGATAASAALAVPEPTTLLLALAAMSLPRRRLMPTTNAPRP
jgi:hypothetical protein